jgi:hypothetical protein
MIDDLLRQKLVNIAHFSTAFLLARRKESGLNPERIIQLNAIRTWRSRS